VPLTPDQVITKDNFSAFKSANYLSMTDDEALERLPGARAISDDATNARHYLIAGYVLQASRVKTLPDFHAIPTAQLKSAPTTAVLTKLHKLLEGEAGKLDDGKSPRDRIFKGTKLRPAYFAQILASAT
jgi:hypothetical protein